MVFSVRAPELCRQCRERHAAAATAAAARRARAPAASAHTRSSNASAGAGAEPPSPGESALERALDSLGAFGLYQRYAVALWCLPGVLAAMYSLNYVFVADVVPFRCLVPECERDGPSELAPALLPPEACARYRPLNHSLASCLRGDYHETDTIPCTAFLYDNQDTTFAEFDLGCREWMRTLVGSVRNSALPVALLLTGYLSDSYGRRTAFCLFGACAGALGLVKAFSYNYTMYVTMEWFEAALGYGFNSAAYVMVVELARPSLRTAFAAATGVAYGVGGVLLALASRRVAYWRHLLLAAHAPALLLPLYWLLGDESARWLHARGHRHRAEAVIRKAARWNKVTLDESLMSEVATENVSGEKKPEGNPWLALLRSRVLLARFGVCCWCWVATAFVYYGLTINSVTLAGDKHVNFALNMAMEVVASLFLVMVLERCGRKWSIFAAFLVCGVVCVTPFFVSHAGTGLGLFMVGKLTITFAFNALYVFTAELFPTATRSSALAACSLVGRLGSVLAPQTPLLLSNKYIQALLYGVCSLLAALALLATPETRRARLPAAVAAAERLRAPPPAPAPAPPPPPAQRVLTADT
ncbi:organic cation transporter protein-like [Leguminivora glycinivorella]|uniref:organic cation transporter protein-like n=1 Tax=Leguminivora glycinivorella TaxID=1035111 RepID=UPI00200BC96A|nr:organic cation transporter protein-like [Leguminivora glycinivorella]